MVYIINLLIFATYLPGTIIRFRPLMIGGILYWIIAVISSFADPSIAPFGMPLAVTTVYLIPGYMLKYKVSHDKI